MFFNKTSVFYSLSLWMFHIFLYKWIFSNLKAQKLPRGIFSFIKSYTQMFMTRISLKINESKNNRVPDTYIHDNYGMLWSLWRLYRIQFNAKSTRRQKASFPKESVENVDLYKPVLNKIITTRLIREIEFRSSFNDIPFFSVVLPTCSLA